MACNITTPILEKPFITIRSMILLITMTFLSKIKCKTLFMKANTTIW